MAIYIALIVAIILLSLITVDLEYGKRQKIIAAVGMLLIYVLLALKAPSVGIDIQGYKYQYQLSAHETLFNINYVYFEAGYIFLQQIFSKIGVSFQLFMAVIYAVVCSAWYFFIRKYSKDATMSLLFFICYQFFVFTTSGIRQALAMALCLAAFIVADSNKKSPVSKVALLLLLMVVAISIHKSAIVFLPIIIAWVFWNKEIRITRNIMIIYIGLIPISILGKRYILIIINLLIEKVSSTTSVVSGGNLIFLIGISLFVIYTYIALDSYKNVDSENKKFESFGVIISMAAVLVNMILSGSPLLRASMYYTTFLVPTIPNMIEKYGYRDRVIVKICFAVFLIALFYIDTLAPNQLKICPYRFFWY